MNRGRKDAPSAELGKLVSELLLHGGDDAAGVVDRSGRERRADGKEGVHPVTRLADLYCVRTKSKTKTGVKEVSWSAFSSEAPHEQENK